MAQYLAELCLVDYAMLQYPGSTVAAATVLLARMTIAHHTHNGLSRAALAQLWTPTVEHYSGYGLVGVRQCLRDVHALHKGAAAATLVVCGPSHQRSFVSRVV